MSNATWDRLAAAGGMISFVLLLIASFVYGDPPDVDAEATTPTGRPPSDVTASTTNRAPWLRQSVAMSSRGW